MYYLGFGFLRIYKNFGINITHSINCTVKIYSEIKNLKRLSKLEPLASATSWYLYVPLSLLSYCEGMHSTACINHLFFTSLKTPEK